MERNSSGALRAPGAFGAIGTSDHHAILSSCLLCITRVCSLAAVPLCCRSAAFGRSTCGGAASSRTGTSGATRRVLRPHCDSAESGFIGRRRRLGRALYPTPPHAGAQALKLLLGAK